MYLCQGARVLHLAERNADLSNVANIKPNLDGLACFFWRACLASKVTHNESQLSVQDLESFASQKIEKLQGVHPERHRLHEKCSRGTPS